MLEGDYFAARDDFRSRARGAGARMAELPIAARGPSGEELTIDIAILGNQSPRRILLHSSGVHGVEGFAGSAVQRAILAERPAPPDDVAIVFVHAVNPFGMAWLRRWNEDNVDLNRNMLAPGERYEGAPPLYSELDFLLNPKSGSDWIDLYYLWAAWMVVRHGFAAVQQAIAQGQYEYARGLFFGGKALAESPRRIVEFLRPLVQKVDQIFHIDFHTGLGAYGEDMLLVEATSDEPIVAELRNSLGPRVTAVDHPASYSVRGSFPSGLAAHLPGPKWEHVTQEFGTYSAMYVLSCLREENRWYHYGGSPEQVDHPVKRRIVEAFVPNDAAWEAKVLERGKELFADAMRMVGK